MKRIDLKAAAFPTIADWSQPSLGSNILLVAAYAEKQARDSVDWYFSGRKIRRVFCRICRLLAIVLTAAAGIIPVVSQAYEQWGLKPVHSTLCLAAAGLWLALDRFWGFTSGWVRYIQTGQQLSNLLEQFRFDFNKERLAWSGAQPSLPQAQAAFVQIRTFVQQVHSVVAEETKAWAAEFSDVLKQFDAEAKALSDTVRKSVLQVNLTNGHQSPVWQMAIDGGPFEPKSGKQAAATVFPGLHVVVVKGQVSGNETRAEGAIDVKAGTVASLDLTLA